MANNLPGKLGYFLIFLCLIFIAFLAYSNFSPNSPLNKKFSSVSTLAPQPTPTIALVKIKRGDGEEFTAGPNCSQLFQIFSKLRFKAMGLVSKEGGEIKMEDLKIDYNKTADVNRDGKVDFFDNALIMKNIGNEKWCLENLEI